MWPNCKPNEREREVEWMKKLNAPIAVVTFSISALIDYVYIYILIRKSNKWGVSEWWILWSH